MQMLSDGICMIWTLWSSDQSSALYLEGSRFILAWRL